MKPKLRIREEIIKIKAENYEIEKRYRKSVKPKVGSLKIFF